MSTIQAGPQSLAPPTPGAGPERVPGPWAPPWVNLKQDWGPNHNEFTALGPHSLIVGHHSLTALLTITEVPSAVLDNYQASKNQ